MTRTNAQMVAQGQATVNAYSEAMGVSRIRAGPLKRPVENQDETLLRERIAIGHQLCDTV